MTDSMRVLKRIGYHRQAIALARRFRLEGKRSTAAFMLNSAAEYRRSLESLLLHVRLNDGDNDVCPF